eukprot:364407-Chlamydomonas_euryale.AAC.14
MPSVLVGITPLTSILCPPAPPSAALAAAGPAAVNRSGPCAQAAARHRIWDLLLGHGRHRGWRKLRSWRNVACGGRVRRVLPCSWDHRGNAAVTSVAAAARRVATARRRAAATAAAACSDGLSLLPCSPAARRVATACRRATATATAAPSDGFSVLLRLCCRRDKMGHPAAVCASVVKTAALSRCLSFMDAGTAVLSHCLC